MYGNIFEVLEKEIESLKNSHQAQLNKNVVLSETIIKQEEEIEKLKYEKEKAIGEIEMLQFDKETYKDELNIIQGRYDEVSKIALETTESLKKQIEEKDNEIFDLKLKNNIPIETPIQGFKTDTIEGSILAEIEDRDNEKDEEIIPIING